MADRLARRRASRATDFLAVTAALLYMRVCLAEHALAAVTAHVAALAQRAGP
jgi:hypothetical protein